MKKEKEPIAEPEPEPIAKKSQMVSLAMDGCVDWNDDNSVDDDDGIDVLCPSQLNHAPLLSVMFMLYCD